MLEHNEQIIIVSPRYMPYRQLMLLRAVSAQVV